MAARDKESMVKSHSKTNSRTVETVPPNSPKKRPLTFDQMVEKWANVIPVEFWDEVDRGRDCCPPPPKEKQQ